MNSSNLALRLEEFERETSSSADLRHAPQLMLVPAAGADRIKPRRLTLTARRILRPDPGLRQFRVY